MMQNPCQSSMYKQYLEERQGLTVVEKPEGFYAFKPEPPVLYLQEIFVLPEHRKSGVGRQWLLEVEEAAKQNLFTGILGSCSPAANGSTESLKAMLACGFHLHSSNTDIIYLYKPIGNKE